MHVANVEERLSLMMNVLNQVCSIFAGGILLQVKLLMKQPVKHMQIILDGIEVLMKAVK